MKTSVATKDSAAGVRRFRRLLMDGGTLPGRQFAWRIEEDPYLKLTAEVLLQRTRAESVALMWTSFVDAFPSAQALGDAAEGDIAAIISRLGLARKRASYLKRLGLALQADGVPSSLDALAALPGVGPYSAAAFMTSSYGARTAPVDANVRRVIGRVFLGVDSMPTATAEPLIRRLLSLGDARTVLFALLDFGAMPCRPRSPRCVGCPASSFCARRREEVASLDLVYFRQAA